MLNPFTNRTVAAMPVAASSGIISGWYNPMEAKQLEIELMQRLIGGECIRCDSVAPSQPSLRDHVLGRLCLRSTVKIEDIGDGRLCLLFVPPVWRHLTPEKLPSLVENQYLFDTVTREYWTVCDGGLDPITGHVKICYCDQGEKPTEFIDDCFPESLLTGIPHMWMRNYETEGWLVYPIEEN
jgi:hypothetical protein